MKSTTVLLILSSFLLVVDCDPIPGLLDFLKSNGAIVPDKTDLELIDHVAVANGPPTTTGLPMSFNESTSTDASSSESSKKGSDIKSSDLFDTSSSTSERPSSTEESGSGADHVQSDHHEPSDATTTLPTTTVISTTSQELKDSPALSKEEPLTTLPSLGTGSSSESAPSSSEPAQSSSESAQSSSEASQPWDAGSEGPSWNEVDSDLDKKEADQTSSDWFPSIFGTDRQQEDFNSQLNQIDPTETSFRTTSSTEEPVKVKDELPLNDKPKEGPPKVNVAGHGSSSASVSKGFNLIAVAVSILFLLTISH